MSTMIFYQMSRFNEYTDQMMKRLDHWYQELPYHKLQQLYGADNITKDLQKSWYKLSYNQKQMIYESKL